ncbi:MAG: histidine phosphatase family protein [Phascolarctobacterium sp.]
MWSWKEYCYCSHGGIVRLQLCMALGIPLNNLWKLSVYNVSVSTLSDWNGTLCAESINVADFLNTEFKASLFKQK